MNVNNLIFKSNQSTLASKTINWFNTDSKDAYIKNLKENFSKLNQYGWIDKPIKYSFNSHGFRCEEFSEENNIVFLGCSITLGVGLNFEDLYCVKVSKNLNLNCCNLALVASGYDTAFRMALSYLDKLKPKIVVLYVPFMNRLELLENKECFLLVPNMKEIPDFYKIWLTTEENSYISKEKNIMAIKHLCHLQKAKLILIENRNIKMNTISLGRDLMHPGSLFHDNLTHEILNFM